jgi:hypothetical protein
MSLYWVIVLLPDDGLFDETPLDENGRVSGEGSMSSDQGSRPDFDVLYRDEFPRLAEPSTP